MNIKQAKNEIKQTVRAYLSREEDGSLSIPVVRQRPLLLIGPPGVGKTQIMEQIAEELKIGLVAYTITHHTRQSAVGLPMIVEKNYGGKKISATEYTMSEIIASIYECMEKTGLKEGILFIDEINCVSETLAPTMLQFLQCKTFGNQKVPEGWVIAAAGNPPEYNKSVREFDLVTLDRVRILPIEADFDVWKEYALNCGVHPAVISYLTLRSSHFYKIETTVDGMAYVTARGWEDFSSLLKTYEKMGVEIEESLIHQFICHQEVAEDMAAYLELYHRYQDDYCIEDILRGTAEPSIYERIYRADFDERYSVVTMILDALKQKFYKCRIESEYTVLWQEFLQELKQRLQSGQWSEGEPVICFQELFAETVERMEEFVKQPYAQKEEVRLRERFVEDARRIPLTAMMMEKEIFRAVKEYYDRQVGVVEACSEGAMNALNRAFEFLEEGCGGKQELVLFVTGLSVEKNAAYFLAYHECEKYLQYSGELMIGSEKRKLLSELALS